MDSDELRRACERLGWKHGPYAEYVTEPHPSGQMLNGKPAVRFWQLDDYALPAYVASLLVAMVRDTGFHYPSGLSKEQHAARVLKYTALIMEMSREFATDEQRIRAAMEVLGDE